MNTKILKISEVFIDKDLYPRISVDWVTTARYYNALKAGAKFPPITVAYSDGKYILVDGAHRLEAVKDLKSEYIDAIVLKGLTKAQIYEKAVELNAAHGRQFSSQEITKIVVTLEAFGASQETISKLIGLPINDIQPFIAKRLSTNSGGEKVFLKSPLKHLAGTIMTDNGEAQSRMVGRDQSQILDMVINMIENDHFNKTSQLVMEKLKALKKLLKTYI